MKAECNCPPVEDVMRGRAGETKPPCPVHPTPELRGLILTPRLSGWKTDTVFAPIKLR